MIFTTEWLNIAHFAHLLRSRLATPLATCKGRPEWMSLSRRLLC